MATELKRAAAQQPPPGFLLIAGLEGFASENGPILVRWEDDGSAVLGCRIMPRMCNPLGVSHGGWIATLCDMSLPLTARTMFPDFNERFLMTISLTIDFLRGPRLGEWIECRARVLRRTSRMVFIDGLVTAGDEVCARASGVFKIGPTAPPLRFAEVR